MTPHRRGIAILTVSNPMSIRLFADVAAATIARHHPAGASEAVVEMLIGVVVRPAQIDELHETSVLARQLGPCRGVLAPWASGSAMGYPRAHDRAGAWSLAVAYRRHCTCSGGTVGCGVLRRMDQWQNLELFQLISETAHTPSVKCFGCARTVHYWGHALIRRAFLSQVRSTLPNHQWAVSRFTATDMWRKKLTDCVSALKKKESLGFLVTSSRRGGFFKA